MIPITGAPNDANFARWAMLHDGADYRLYLFRGSSSDTLYQFAWNGSSYEYGYRSIPVLTLVGSPPDVDASSIRMLHSGGAYHAYMRRLGDPTTLYQYIWQPGTTHIPLGRTGLLPEPAGRRVPADADWTRWNMLHDGSDFRIYTFRYGSVDRMYQGAFDPGAGAYVFGYRSIPELRLTGYPADSQPGRSAMLHDGSDYRFYFQSP